jgi:hypothetical protein
MVIVQGQFDITQCIIVITTQEGSDFLGVDGLSGDQRQGQDLLVNTAGFLAHFLIVNLLAAGQHFEQTVGSHPANWLNLIHLVSQQGKTDVKLRNDNQLRRKTSQATAVMDDREAMIFFYIPAQPVTDLGVDGNLWLPQVGQIFGRNRALPIYTHPFIKQHDQILPQIICGRPQSPTRCQRGKNSLDLRPNRLNTG